MKDEDIKKIIQESAKTALPETVVESLVIHAKKYIEDQLAEGAEELFSAQNEIETQFETLKENFINWVDETAEKLAEEKKLNEGINEINSDIKTFMKFLNEMSKKYNVKDLEDEENEEESEDDDDEEDKKEMTKKKSKMKNKKDDEDEDDEEKENLKESLKFYKKQNETLKESLTFLEKQNEKLIKCGLISEKIFGNNELSENQKNDLKELIENVEFDGDINSLIHFINSKVSLKLQDNETEQSAIPSKNIEESVNYSETKLVKPLKNQIKKPREGILPNIDVKSISSKLV